MKLLDQLIGNATVHLLLTRDEREAEYWRRELETLTAIKKELI
jgi:hypothetical protein